MVLPAGIALGQGRSRRGDLQALPVRGRHRAGESEGDGDGQERLPKAPERPSAILAQLWGGEN